MKQPYYADWTLKPLRTEGLSRSRPSREKQVVFGALYSA